MATEVAFCSSNFSGGGIFFTSFCISGAKEEDEREDKPEEIDADDEEEEMAE